MLKSKNTFLILAAFVPLSLFFRAGVTSASMILFIIYCVYNAHHDIRASLKSKKMLLFPVILFLLYCIGILYSPNWNEGVSLVIRKLPLLLFPLGLIIVNKELNEKELHLIFTVLLIGCIGISLFCYIRAVINIVQNQTVVYPDHVYKMYYYAYIPLVRPFEPIYLSLFSNMAFLIAIKSPLIKSSLLRKVIAGYIGIFIILIAAKGGLIAFLIIVLLLITRTQNKKVLSYIFLLALIPLFLFSIYKFNFLRERFLTSLTFDYTEKHGGVWNSSTLRLAIWSSAIDAIKKSPTLGYGTGGGQMALEEEYVNKGFVFGVFYKDHPGIPQYNAHNQFLSTTLDVGLGGAIILFLIFIYSTTYSIKLNDPIVIGFTIIIFIFFSVESVLLRQKGIFFFSFFYSFLFQNRILPLSSDKKHLK
jgi:O-antigen ligase